VIKLYIDFYHHILTLYNGSQCRATAFRVSSQKLRVDIAMFVCPSVCLCVRMNERISEMVRPRITKIWCEDFLYLHADQVYFRFWIPSPLYPQYEK